MFDLSYRILNCINMQCLSHNLQSNIPHFQSWISRRLELIVECVTFVNMDNLHEDTSVYHVIFCSYVAIQALLDNIP